MLNAWSDLRALTSTESTGKHTSELQSRLCTIATYIGAIFSSSDYIDGVEYEQRAPGWCGIVEWELKFIILKNSNGIVGYSLLVEYFLKMLGHSVPNSHKKNYIKPPLDRLAPNSRYSHIKAARPLWGVILQNKDRARLAFTPLVRRLMHRQWRKVYCTEWCTATLPPNVCNYLQGHQGQRKGNWKIFGSLCERFISWVNFCWEKRRD